MPTLRGLRRRGYTPASIRAFWDAIGVARRNHTIQLGQLEASVREDLNRLAPRVMGVLRPLRLVIENYAADRHEEFDVPNNPEDPSAGTRRVRFSRELWIEQGDFLEDPPRKYHRLAPGREVRLRSAYLVTCTGFDRDPATGEVSEVRCRYDPETRGGGAPDGRKVRGTLHWVSAAHAVPVEVRLYETLFSAEDPTDVPEGEDFLVHLNPDSLRVLERCPMEPALAGAEPGSRFQLERIGYFCVDPDSRDGKLVLNRTVTLRDTWAKIARAGGGGG